MKINLLKCFISALLLCLIFQSSMACSITKADKLQGGKCIEVGQFQIYAQIYGKASPVVIFDSGSGDDLSVWKLVAPVVAKFARVILYDRAGLGKSDSMPGHGSISSEKVLKVLKSLLKKENIKPPYILVGHSRGGLNMQLFAEKYSDEIKGIVLIDSVSRNQAFHDPAPPKDSPYYREAISFEESQREVKKGGLFPNIPLIVLTATKQHGSKERELLWRKWQKEMTQLSPQGIQIFAWGAPHYIQKQQPELVINAIYTVIQSAGLNS